MYISWDYRYVNVTFMTSSSRTGFVANEDYVGVRLPKELIAEVDRLVNRKALGFRSRAEFIADAIRRRLEEVIAVEKSAGKVK